MTKKQLTWTILISAVIITSILIYAAWPNILTLFFEENKSIETWADREVERIRDSLSDVPLEETNLPQPNADSPAPNAVINSSTIYAVVTAYTTRPEEGTNCISFYRQNLCYRFEYLGEQTIACPATREENTIIEVKGKKYKCADRMAERYWYQERYDIYMGWGEDRVEEAEEWGKQYLEIKIYEL